MKKIFLPFIAILFLIVFAQQVRSQGVTMYHMHLMQHKHQLNPAFPASCGFYLGVPGLSSINFEIQARGFKVGDLIENVNSFESSISAANSIANQLDLNVFSMGFRAGKSYWTFDASIRNNMNLNLSQDFILFATGGNESFIGETADFSGTGIQETLYLEYALGYSRSFGDRLRLGAKVKYLNGLANFSFSDWNAGIYTAPDTYEMTLHSAGSVNLSGPLTLQYDPDNPEVISGYELIEDQDQLLENYLMRNSNKGFAFDLGFSYQVFDWLQVSGSALDLFNHINWNQNVYNIQQDGEFLFEGLNLEFDSELFSDENFEQELENLVDSMLDVFQLTNTNNTYRSSFGPRYYAGVDLQLFPGLNLSGLVRGTRFNNKTYLSYTGSVNMRFWRILSLSASATSNPNGSMSLGGGFGLKLAGLQVFAIAENVNALYYDKEETMVWPGNFDRIQLRTGLNFMFGCKPKRDLPENPAVDLIPTVTPVDSLSQPTDSLMLKNDSLGLPSDTLLLKNDTLDLPMDTVMNRADTLEIPAENLPVIEPLGEPVEEVLPEQEESAKEEESADEEEADKPDERVMHYQPSDKQNDGRLEVLVFSNVRSKSMESFRSNPYRTS